MKMHEPHILDESQAARRGHAGFAEALLLQRAPVLTAVTGGSMVGAAPRTPR
jgi:hypothetical protein